MSSKPTAGASGFLSWLKTQSKDRLLVDLIVIFGLAVFVRLATFDLELFEWFADYSRAHEHWELDEILVTALIMTVALIVFVLRRIQDQRRELKLRLAAEMHATMLSLQDPLTGLPNRRRFQQVLQSIAGSENARHAVLILDLDGFKPLNDVFGHAIGDEALRTLAQRMKALGDDRILCARLGGDEFAMIVRNVVSREDAERIAAMAISAAEIPIIAAGSEHRLEISVGISLIEGQFDMAEEHLRRADVALYHAKQKHGSTYAFYDPSMDIELRELVRIETDLRAALAAQQIVPHYQPIVDLRTGEILKFEALARWNHPTRGNIPPAQFIPVAESRGLIAEVTESMLRQCCRDAIAWPQSVMLSFNLSAVLLQSKAFGLRLANILAETGFPPSRLELEVTEQALRTDLDLVTPFLENLRTLGVKVAIDDFGTGYSSLSRLRQLPFDEIKIDRSFVQTMTRETNGADFVWTIIQLGQGLNMTVTAEGVEDPDQRDRLIAEGCMQGQGYLFSAAVPAAEALAMVQKTEARVARG